VTEPLANPAQTLLPAGGTPKASRPTSTSTPTASTSRRQSGASSSTSKSKIAPNKLVRTDAQSQTLDALFPALPSTSKTRNVVDADAEGDGTESDRPSKKRKSDHDPAFAAQLAAEQAAAQRSARVRIAQSECALTSVKQLRKEVLEARHKGA